VRAELRRRGIPAVISTRSNQRRRREFDRAVHAGRNRVERRVNRLEQFRRVATRYEKRACNYLAMVKLAAALIWL
jgi:transposase